MAEDVVEGVLFSLNTHEDVVGLPTRDEGTFVLGFYPLSFRVESLGLPDRVDLDAYSSVVDGPTVFSVDSTAPIGAVLARPEDLVQVEDGVYSVVLDGSALGVPPGVNLDAASHFGGGYIVSFDQTVELTTTAGPTSVEDEDLIFTDGVTFGSVLFDGSAAGLSPKVDVTAAWVSDDGATFALIFDTSGTVDGIHFDDEDMLTFNGSAWTLINVPGAIVSGASAVDALHLLVGDLLFQDGFESGDLSAWSP